MTYDPDNLFARMARGGVPCIRVYEDEATLAFMDIMPQADGHTLVIPKVAGENLLDTPPAAVAAAALTAQKVARAVQRAFAAPGIVLTQFSGESAGQTVFHLHFHVIPAFGGPLRRHGRERADPATLERHAERIRAELVAG